MHSEMKSLLDDENFTVQTGRARRHALWQGVEAGNGFTYYLPAYSLAAYSSEYAGVDTATERFIHSPLTYESFQHVSANTELVLDAPSTRVIQVGLKPPPEADTRFRGWWDNRSLPVLLSDDLHGSFKESVQEDLAAINGFAAQLGFGETPDEETRERAIFGKQDLDQKLLWLAKQYASLGVSGPGARLTALTTGTASGLINVRVNTKDTSSAAVSGCVVWYVTRINHNKPGSYQSFSTFSTPTTESLAVGNYEIWAEKAGSSGPRHVVSVVSTTAMQTVDVLTP